MNAVDGKVAKTEPRQLPRLLVRVQKEKARRQTEHSFVQALGFERQAATAFDLSTAKLRPERAARLTCARNWIQATVRLLRES